MNDRDLIELVSCAGVKNWQLWAVHCIQNPRISNKLKGQTFVHFPEIQFHPWDEDSRQVIKVLGSELSSYVCYEDELFNVTVAVTAHQVTSTQCECNRHTL